MYTLDFETMRQVMQEHQKTGFLQADVPGGVMGLREPCRIEINILAGVLVSCAIVGASGRRLTGIEAARELARLERLRWTFTPQQEPSGKVVQQMPSAPQTQITADSALMPRRTMQLEQRQMHAWPRLHRGVFALADGNKSSMKMAEMLSTSPELVDQALRDLQSIGVIVIEASKRNGHG